MIWPSLSDLVLCHSFGPVRDSLRTGLWYYNRVLRPSLRSSGFRQKLLIATLILGSILPAGCRRVQFDDRPLNAKINTIVVHSINPGGNDPSIVDAKDMLIAEDVSAHYVIGRDGDVENIVPEDKRAWHAGKSHYPFNPEQSADVNDISIGIELVTTKDRDFTKEQCDALISLIQELMIRHQITFVVGHEHIATKRGKSPKTDPGDKFDWQRLLGGLYVAKDHKWAFVENHGIIKLMVKKVAGIPQKKSSKKKKRVPRSLKRR